MPRGFSRDGRITNLLYDNGLLEDERSFIGYDMEMAPHLLLAGMDVSRQRERLWQDRKEENGDRICGLCGMEILNPKWQMDHIEGGHVGRCDCLHNLQPVHVACHKRKHVQVQLGNPTQDEKDFDKLYPKGE